LILILDPKRARSFGAWARSFGAWARSFGAWARSFGAERKVVRFLPRSFGALARSFGAVGVFGGRLQEVDVST
jgi:hypothetical protein